MSIGTISMVTVALIAGLGTASAATVQNSRGTFIQDRNGSWHQYVRLSHRRSLADAYASADYNVSRRYNLTPQLRRSVAYYAVDDSVAWSQPYRGSQFRMSAAAYDQVDAPGQYIVSPRVRYSGWLYANEGTMYPVGGPSNANFGILSER